MKPGDLTCTLASSYGCTSHDFDVDFDVDFVDVEFDISSSSRPTSNDDSFRVLL